MKKYDLTWFSIVLALGFMILMSSIGIYLLEYMIPFSRNTKWIENSSKAYYQSYGWIEDALLYSFSWGIWSAPNDILSWSLDYWYTTLSNASSIPQPWFWVSPFDSDWNIISQSVPIQISVWDGRLSWWSVDIEIELRVPDFDSSSVDSLDTTPNDDMILWQLASGNDSISTRNGAFIRESEINTWGYRSLWSWTYGNGVTQWWNNSTFSSFYGSNCGSWNECIFKASILNTIESSSGKIFPFLEYRIRTSDPIPTRFRQIESEWQSANYRNNLEISVLQQNTNAAFDFAILQ